MAPARLLRLRRAHLDLFHSPLEAVDRCGCRNRAGAPAGTLESWFRDLAPLLLMLIAFREMDWFTPAIRDHRLEQSWIVWDRMLLNQPRTAGDHRERRPAAPRVFRAVLLAGVRDRIRGRVGSAGAWPEESAQQRSGSSIWPARSAHTRSSRISHPNRRASCLPAPTSPTSSRTCGDSIYGSSGISASIPACSPARMFPRRFPRPGDCSQPCPSDAGSDGRWRRTACALRSPPCTGAITTRSTWSRARR